MATWKLCFWIALCVCFVGSFARAQEAGSAPASPEVAASAPADKASAPADKGSSPKQPASFWEEFLSNPLWLMMAMLLVFYVGVLLPTQRSNRRQQRELAELISSLKKNDRVVTSFGVHGVVVSTQPDVGTVTLRLDETSNAKMTVNRDTIRVVKKD